MIVVHVFLFSCNHSTTKDTVANKADSTTVLNSTQIQVYYFHLTNRCATCNSIEANVKSVLETDFASEMQQGVISFESLNIQEKQNWEIAESYQTANASLFITRNTEKGKQTSDLTSQAFMMSLQKPEEFKKIIRDTIQSLLK